MVKNVRQETKQEEVKDNGRSWHGSDGEEEGEHDSYFKSQGMTDGEIQKKKADAMDHAAAAMAKGSKTQIVYHVKPWEAGCDLDGLWNKIVSNKLEGLTWGEGYSTEDVTHDVKKLVLSCVIDDKKITTTDDVEDIINQYVDEIQSCDMANMNKVSDSQYNFIEP